MSSNYSRIPVVVVGAGVSGITTALVLQRTLKYQVAVVSENLPIEPSDLHAKNWASPFAGANWHAFADENDHFMKRIELDTLHEMRSIADQFPESTVKRVKGIDYSTAKDYKQPWFFEEIGESSYIPKDKIPFGLDIGFEFDTVILNSPEYLLWLTDRFLALGGTIKKAKMKSLSQAVGFCPNGPQVLECIPILVNCTALGSHHLSDVKDSKVYPIRGQVILVDSPAVKKIIMNDSAWRYVIPRGNGTVIIGGTYQKGSWDPKEDPVTTQEIINETLLICPELVDEHTPTTPQNIQRRAELLKKRIIIVNVGFRPARTGGTRIELDSVFDSSHQLTIPVVHNYGHGGYGYQTSWGFAFEARRLCDLASINIRKKSSKL
ncbi:D-amino-acid oxidase [Smittium mucronatum]|uniref:D-amino-acid oxidase n=1 Tax=Smittium mucronatum TaxID=133383 RepID=A0A1R0GST1_9FUNG|nr:D-amino-acid oxidase [Smittium mucronatum]